jgi:hypothetical protein
LALIIDTMPHLTTHSTGLAIRLAFIIHIDCSPVNSGVRFLFLWKGKVPMKNILLAITIILSPLFYGIAFGCNCPTIGGTSEQLKAARLEDFERAAAIFTGEVIVLEENLVKFKVEKIWKGDSVDEISMTIRQGRYNGKAVRTSCDYHFKLGEKYLVYAYFINDELNTGACSRTTPLKQVERAEEEMKGLVEIKLPEIRGIKSAFWLMLIGEI